MQWAEQLEAGYFDQPPMIGWILWAVSQLSDSVFAYRMVVFAIGVATALVLFHVARPLGKPAAWLAASLYVASPMHMLQFLVTNDSILLLSCGLTVLCFQRALRYGSGHYKWPVLGGLALGCAALSKFFALFLYVSLLLVAIRRYKDGGLKHLLVMSVVALPFGWQHLHYNLENCWNSVAFSWFGGIVEGEPMDWGFVGEYLLVLLYVLMPWTFAYLLIQRRRWWRSELMLPIAVGLVPLWLFFAVPFKREVGLNWLLAFVPFLYPLVTALTVAAQQRILKLSIAFGMLHAVILLALALVPTSVYVNNTRHGDYAMFLQPQQLCAEIAPWKDTPTFAGSYTTSTLISQLCDREIYPLFDVSKYSRIADTRVDLRALDGQRLVYLVRGEADTAELAPFFESLQVQHVDVSGSHLSVLIGDGFNFQAYRQHYLQRIYEQFYQRPDWLPPAACEFKQRYFPPQT